MVLCHHSCVQAQILCDRGNYLAIRQFTWLNVSLTPLTFWGTINKTFFQNTRSILGFHCFFFKEYHCQNEIMTKQGKENKLLQHLTHALGFCSLSRKLFLCLDCRLSATDLPPMLTTMGNNCDNLLICGLS